MKQDTELKDLRLRKAIRQIKMMSQQILFLQAENDMLLEESQRMQVELQRLRLYIRKQNSALGVSHSENAPLPAMPLSVSSSLNGTNGHSKNGHKRNRSNKNGDVANLVSSNGVHKNGNGTSLSSVHQAPMAHSNGGHQNDNHADSFGSHLTAVSAVAENGNGIRPNGQRLPIMAKATLRDANRGKRVAQIEIDADAIASEDLFGVSQKLQSFRLVTGDLDHAWRFGSDLWLCLRNGDAKKVIIAAKPQEESGLGMLKFLI